MCTPCAGTSHVRNSCLFACTCPIVTSPEKHPKIFCRGMHTSATALFVRLASWQSGCVCVRHVLGLCM
jgi:hypothetical protein